MTLSQPPTKPEKQTSNDFMSMANAIALTALNTPDIQTMLQEIADRFGHVLNADGCMVTLWDELAQVTALHAYSARCTANEKQRLHSAEMLLGQNQTPKIQPIVIENQELSSRVESDQAVSMTAGAVLSLPLIIDEKQLGAVLLTFSSARQFNGNEIECYEQAVNQFAWVVEKARILETERLNRKRIEALYHITEALTSFESLDSQLQTVTSRVAEALPADWVKLIALDTEKQQILHFINGGSGAQDLDDITYQELMDGLTGWCLRTLKPILSTKAMMPDPRESTNVQARRKRYGCGSLIVVPLQYQGRTLGTLTAINRLEQRDFTQQDVELMTAMANQAVVAIENTHLGQAISQRLKESETLAQVTAQLTHSLDLDHVLHSIVQASRHLISGANGSVIHFIDKSGQRLIPKAASPETTAIPNLLGMAVGEGIAGLVIQVKRTINVPDAKKDERFIPTHTFPPSRSMLTAPLIVDNEIIGTLSLNSTQVAAFDKNDERLLTTLANQAAIAVRNANMHQQLGQHVQDLTFLNRVGQTLASSLDPDQVFRLVMEKTADVMNTEAASIMLLDENRKELVFQVAVGEASEKAQHLRLSVNEGIAGQVAREGKPIIAGDVSENQTFYPDIDKVTGLTTRSILAVPLRVRDKVIGVIEAVNKREGVFAQADVDLMLSMAQSAAIAIENAQLYRDLQQRMRELERTQTQLIQSARLAAVGKLAEGAAHELNNPLAIIVGYTQLLLEGLGQDKAMQEDLEIIDQAANRAHRIVRALLDFSSQTVTSDQAPVNINDAIQQALSMVCTEAKETGVTILKEYDPNLPQVLGQREQLSQAFLNILNNAVQAMPDGGELAIETWCCKDPNRADMDNDELESDVPYLVTKITDTGIGIASENLPRIFDPFFSTHTVGKGMGLGLAVCHGIIDRHRGKIIVASKVGHGSTFTVLLPVITEGQTI